MSGPRWTTCRSLPLPRPRRRVPEQQSHGWMTPGRRHAHAALQSAKYASPLAGRPTCARHRPGRAPEKEQPAGRPLGPATAQAEPTAEQPAGLPAAAPSPLRPGGSGRACQSGQLDDPPCPRHRPGRAGKCRACKSGQLDDTPGTAIPQAGRQSAEGATEATWMTRRALNRTGQAAEWPECASPPGWITRQAPTTAKAWPWAS